MKTKYDPVAYAFYNFCARQRQTKKKVGFKLAEFRELWRGMWHLRGTLPHELCLSLINHNGDYTLDNVEIITNLERYSKISAQHSIRVAGPDGRVYKSRNEAIKTLGITEWRYRTDKNKGLWTKI